MKKLKTKNLVIGIIVILIVIGTLGGYFYLNRNSNRYSFSEKRWINDKTNTVIDVNITSDLPIFSLNGGGVYYDFIRDFETDTSLSFNILHDTDEAVSFGEKSTVTKNDITFYKDHYVVISRDKKSILSLNDLKNNTIGVISTDLSNVSNYLCDYSNITFKTYNTIDDINIGLGSKDISMAIVPLYKNLNKILTLNYNIEYHLDGLYSYYTASINEDNKVMRNIMQKFLNRWKGQVSNKIGEYFLDLYYNANGTTELEKESITGDDLLVGYIENIPYEGIINRHFTGYASSYLDAFANLTGATYKYKKYDSIDKLMDALNDKKIDIIFNPYGLSNSAYVETINSYSSKYVVLAHYSSTLVVNSLYSLNNMNVSMIDNMNLTSSIENKKLFTIEKHSSVKSLLKGLDEDSIIIVEKYVYDYYKDKDLRDYNVRYDGTVVMNTSYLLKGTNTALAKLFNFYTNTLSNKEMEYEAVNASITSAKSNVISSFLLNNIFYVSIVIVILIILVYRFSNKLYLSKRIKKEDRMLYLDMLTNLKNRNYLNDNIEYWEKNKVYPQAVVLLDLNKVKELNDKYGHEEGDKQIQSAANILIRTQRENSEIIRTDGNEFMVYLVGYDEKFIISYLHKLNREFKTSLPYETYGVAIGYSIIENDLKTIDDAINEAAIMMRENKGSTNKE